MLAQNDCPLRGASVDFGQGASGTGQVPANIEREKFKPCKFKYSVPDIGPTQPIWFLPGCGEVGLDLVPL